MDKILTVVIPTYNMQSLLPRCLESLISPECSEKLEVLIINDGSKDDSLKIAREYETRYPGIFRAVDKENGNYGSAVNRGIQEATGKYLKILDADDFYNNEGLMHMLHILSQNDVDMVLTDYCRDRGDERIFFRAPKEKCNKIHDFDKISIEEYGNFAMHGIAYRTSILQNNHIELQTGISYTDAEYCFYPLTYVKSILVLDIVVYCYQLGREGQTVDIKSQIKSIGSMVRIIDRMFGFLYSHSKESSVFSKQRYIFCNSTGLCFMTVLCYDKSNQHLNVLSRLASQVDEIPGAKEIMFNKRMFGVPYYQRFVLKNKLSNGIFLSAYYNLVKKAARGIFRIKSRLCK